MIQNLKFLSDFAIRISDSTFPLNVLVRQGNQMIPHRAERIAQRENDQRKLSKRRRALVPLS